MMQAYTSEYANVHRGLHYLANAATEAYEGARTKVAQFLNARRTEEFVLLVALPRRSIWSPRLSAASASHPGMRLFSRSWSTTPTSCPGIF